MYKTFIIIFILLISFFTPLNRILYGNILSRIIGLIVIIVRKVIKYTPEEKRVGIFPVIPGKLLKRFGFINTALDIPMPIWRKMELSPNNFISVTHGVNFFVVGKTNFWGKASFLDPEDVEHYHLWYGIYILPLDSIYSLENDKKVPIDLYGYNRHSQTVNVEQIFLIIQYDYYNYFYPYRRLVCKGDDNEFFRTFRFTNLDLEVNQTKDCEYCWELKGQVNGKSLMYYTKNPLLQFGQAAAFGWIPKSAENNITPSTYKGKLIVSYRDINGQITDPTSTKAATLTAGYVFGIIWDQGRKQTPDRIINELADSFVTLQYKVI